MSQHDFEIANQTAFNARDDINDALQALASNSGGPSAPSTPFANMWWYDSSNNKLYIRNEGNTAWIDTDYQVVNKWDEPIDVNKNPLFKALKLGISVFKDQKPPTMDQINELNDTTKEFVDENLPKF